jgi:hypothetical protein
MAKFDYKWAREQIAEINAIVESCPDAVKERSFELLFATVFSLPVTASRPAEPDVAVRPEENTAEHKSDPTQRKKLPPNVLAFAHRNGLAPEDTQMCKVMMVLLENGLLNNSLSAPYVELRESAKEDGFYDGNFNKLLKRNHELFKGAISEDTIEGDKTVELTGPGFTKLAEIVKELGQ